MVKSAARAARAPMAAKTGAKMAPMTPDCDGNFKISFPLVIFYDDLPDIAFMDQFFDLRQQFFTGNLEFGFMMCCHFEYLLQN